MLVSPNSIGILPKSDVESDVGQAWQGLAQRGKERYRIGLAVTSPP